MRLLRTQIDVESCSHRLQLKIVTHSVKEVMLWRADSSEVDNRLNPGRRGAEREQYSF